MRELVVAVAVAVVVAAVAAVLRRRRPAPLVAWAGGWSVPASVDRADFPRPDAPWLVVAFTSATCSACTAVWERCQVLASEDVAVAEAEAKADKRLHERYRVDAVPLVVVVDAVGAVRRSFLGPLDAATLWGALAELRVPPGEPGLGEGP
jgi:hypothetical protein